MPLFHLAEAGMDGGFFVFGTVERMNG